MKISTRADGVALALALCGAAERNIERWKTRDTHTGAYVTLKDVTTKTVTAEDAGENLGIGRYAQSTLKCGEMGNHNQR